MKFTMGIVAKANEHIFKIKLDRLCAIQVLERCGASEWAAPTFIVPKKDGRIRWVSGFCELNKRLRHIYPS